MKFMLNCLNIMLCEDVHSSQKLEQQREETLEELNGFLGGLGYV